ncbi:hypothetical protein QTP88_028195 [Uroleucon formosanum]
MSPMHKDFSQRADEECGIDEFFTQINPTQATWAPIRKTKSLHIDDPISLPTTVIDKQHRRNSDNFAQYPSWYTTPEYKIPSPASPAIDENDGPMSFNRSPSILDFTGGKPMKKINQRNAKRKLFV